MGDKAIRLAKRTVRESREHYGDPIPDPESISVFLPESYSRHYPT